MIAKDLYLEQNVTLYSRKLKIGKSDKLQYNTIESIKYAGIKNSPQQVSELDSCLSKDLTRI